MPSHLKAFIVHVVAIASLLSLSGCSAAVWDGVAAGLQGAAQGAAAVPPSTTKLMLFGGPNHKTYLGCLSCSEYSSDSLFNQFGAFGNKFSSTSILNSFSQFGSAYSQYSACNEYASDPPVIVDGNGRFYGRLTANRYNAQRTTNQKLLGWLAAVCEGK